MFHHLPPAVIDPILSVAEAFQHDSRPNKLDLSIGVYRDTLGHTPIMRAVKTAAIALASEQRTKSYLGPAGNLQFNAAITRLMLGQAAPTDQWVTVQTPGASGGLRLLADLIAASRPHATVWISNPSYANHAPIMQAAGLTVRHYPYLDAEMRSLDRAAFFDHVRQLGLDDVLLVHGSCHNPSGVDLEPADWQMLAGLASRQGFVPFIDMAYQGFGDGLEADAGGLRIMDQACEQLLAVYSCSKHFGLYRERTGAALVKGRQPSLIRHKLFELARRQYTMPPDHGAEIVARILTDAALRQDWEVELAAMRQRILQTRHALVNALAKYDMNARHLLAHRGMFSMLPLSEPTLEALRAQAAIYLIKGGRINLAGLPVDQTDRLAQAIAAHSPGLLNQS
ncbi:aspartate/tyrosine/aromatic aminotransferase [Chitinivorax tropicus]|uniref:Aspartate/tyrosine/aromatic aminotransferase n=1 Tax=Chitinivorax tropicus TaxID=714531 RepID=A0A840MJ75_9PROT|nr:aromatic amino acid transaminase [Chitinivorax tropicus]MBB5017239.1 aspartate/tyrosine/aromatic aminotransferase [Chitinivorax tropicus]